MKEEPHRTDMDRADFMESFIEGHTPPPEAVEHFRSIEWTRKYVQDPAYKIIPTYSRHLKSSGEDFFFSNTVNSHNTIPHFIALRLKQFPILEDTKGQAPTASTEYNHRTSTVVPDKPDLVYLLQLGEHGLDGHPGIMHGGMACAVLDETMGLLIMLHHHQEVVERSGDRTPLYTVNLNTSYRAPVPTNSQIMVRCWLVKREGRKWQSLGQIVDHNGIVLTEARGTWVVANNAKL